MKRPVDLGRRFLALADRDIKTFHLLAAIPDSDDQAVGFHAQQSIEKCIKAVLSVSEIAFRKTHDLVELIDLLRDRGKNLPPDAEALSTLNPFAVTMRYDLFEVEALQRDWMVKTVETVRAWAAHEIEIVERNERSRSESEAAATDDEERPTDSTDGTDSTR